MVLSKQCVAASTTCRLAASIKTTPDLRNRVRVRIRVRVKVEVEVRVKVGVKVRIGIRVRVGFRFWVTETVHPVNQMLWPFLRIAGLLVTDARQVWREAPSEI